MRANADCGLRIAEAKPATQRDTDYPLQAAANTVGELSPALVRAWGPLLKPTGLGLLLALHSFEETTPGHPFFGWAHCTQTALATYLDTSQDTIARYSNLLLICGLMQVQEVETARGKQKLYRVTRDLPLPSLGLLEYLLFDADTWTRKHTGWLARALAPLGAETELTRLTAILGRAYRVQFDRAGVATLVDGQRLTAPGSYRQRTATARQMGLRIAEGESEKESAPGGVAGDIRDVLSFIEGLDESARCGLGGAKESAWGGVGGWGSPRGAESGESAEGGLGAPALPDPAVGGQRESAGGGLVLASSNVDRLTVKKESETETNANGADDPATDNAPLDDLAALLDWGTAALNDAGSREWHRQCLADYGPELYAWAIEATRRAQAKGRVSKPGAYFTSLLRRRGRMLPLAPEAQGAGDPTPLPAESATNTRRAQVVAPAAPHDADSFAEMGEAAVAAPAAPHNAESPGLPAADCARLWQGALIHLRVALPADDYQRVLRYATLLSLDPASGQAVLGVPAAYMREAVQTRLAPLIGAVLGQLCGAALVCSAVVR